MTKNISRTTGFRGFVEPCLLESLAAPSPVSPPPPPPAPRVTGTALRVRRDQCPSPLLLETGPHRGNVAAALVSYHPTQCHTSPNLLYSTKLRGNIEQDFDIIIQKLLFGQGPFWTIWLTLSYSGQCLCSVKLGWRS